MGAASNGIPLQASVFLLLAVRLDGLSLGAGPSSSSKKAMPTHWAVQMMLCSLLSLVSSILSVQAQSNYSKTYLLLELLDHNNNQPGMRSGLLVRCTRSSG